MGEEITNPGSPIRAEMQAHARLLQTLKTWTPALGVASVIVTALLFILDRPEAAAAKVEARVGARVDRVEAGLLRIEAKSDAQIQVIREEIRDFYNFQRTGQRQPNLEAPPAPVQPLTTQTEP